MELKTMTILILLLAFSFAYCKSLPNGQTIESPAKRFVEDDYVPYDYILDEALPGPPGPRIRGRYQVQRQQYKRPSFHPWAGKRSAPNTRRLDGLTSDMDNIVKRLFRPWGGKRIVSPVTSQDTQSLKVMENLLLLLHKVANQEDSDDVAVEKFINILNKYGEDEKFAKSVNDKKAEESIDGEKRNEQEQSNTVNTENNPQNPDLWKRQFSAWGGKR